MLQNDIWKPDLALLNGFESLVEFGDKFMFVVVDSNGDCQWRPYQILASTCKIDMTNYPYDTQSCDLKVRPDQNKSVRACRIHSYVGTFIYFN